MAACTLYKDKYIATVSASCEDSDLYWNSLAASVSPCYLKDCDARAQRATDAVDMRQVRGGSPAVFTTRWGFRIYDSRCSGWSSVMVTPLFLPWQTSNVLYTCGDV